MSRRARASLACTLVATCDARGINPFSYLSDVIPRVQDHPKRRLDELLPGPWAALAATPSLHRRSYGCGGLHGFGWKELCAQKRKHGPAA
jgi:hypothetical protein